MEGELGVIGIEGTQREPPRTHPRDGADLRVVVLIGEEDELQIRALPQVRVLVEGL